MPQLPARPPAPISLWASIFEALRWLEAEELPCADDRSYAVTQAGSLGMLCGSTDLRRHLFMALQAGRITIYGHPVELGAGAGRTSVHAGPFQPISPTLIALGGLPSLDFLSNTLEHVDARLPDGRPISGWRYLAVQMPTKDLIAAFPPSNGPIPQIEPPPLGIAPSDSRALGYGAPWVDLLKALVAEMALDVGHDVKKTEIIKALMRHPVPDHPHHTISRVMAEALASLLISPDRRNRGGPIPLASRRVHPGNS